MFVDQLDTTFAALADPTYGEYHEVAEPERLVFTLSDRPVQGAV